MEFFFIIYGVIVTHVVCSYLPESVSLNRRGLFAGVLTSLLSFLGLVFMVNRGLITDIPTFQLLSASVLGALWGVMLVFLGNSYVELLGQSKDTQKTFVFTILSPFQNSRGTYLVGALFLSVMIPEILSLQWFPVGHEDSGRVALLVLMGIFFLCFVLKKVWARTALVLMLSLLFYDGIMQLVLQTVECPMTQVAIVLRTLGVFLLFLTFLMPLRGAPALALFGMIGAAFVYPVYLQLLSSIDCTLPQPVSTSSDATVSKQFGAENRYAMVLPEGFQFISRGEYLSRYDSAPEEADLFIQSLNGLTYGYTEIYEVDPVAEAPTMPRTIKELYARFRKTYWVEYERLQMLKDSVNSEGFDLQFNFHRASGSGGLFHSFRYGNFAAMSVTIQSRTPFEEDEVEALDEILMGIHLVKDPARVKEHQERVLHSDENKSR